MKILLLCATPPRPDGLSDSVVAYNRIRILVQRGHQVSLACFLSQATEAYPVTLESMVQEMELLPPPQKTMVRRIVGNLQFLVHSNPFAGPTSRDMQKLVGRLVERTQCDVLMAESTAMGPYLFENPFLPAVHRVMSRQGVPVPFHTTVLSNFGLPAGHLRERILRRAIEAYELRLYRFVDHVVTLTPRDRLKLLRRCPDLNVSVIPYGIDIGTLPRAGTRAPVSRILMLGCFNETADRQDTRWFLRDVWPAVSADNPQIALCICGPGATRLCRGHVAADDRVELIDEGGVPPDRLVQASQIFVCPMRTDAGFQGRVLRMLGSGLAVVATSRAVEGIPVRTGTDVFLADTPHTMQEVLQVLIDDATVRGAVGDAAREMVGQCFSWQRSVDGLETVLKSLVV